MTAKSSGILQDKASHKKHYPTIEDSYCKSSIYNDDPDQNPHLYNSEQSAVNHKTRCFACHKELPAIVDFDATGRVRAYKQIIGGSMDYHYSHLLSPIPPTEKHPHCNNCLIINAKYRLKYQRREADNEIWRLRHLRKAEARMNIARYYTRLNLVQTIRKQLRNITSIEKLDKINNFISRTRG